MDSVDFKGAKIPTITIPKGTLLFRAVRHSEGDFTGADVSPGRRCIPRNYNVFFYLDPFVADIHTELANVQNVDVYMTPHDLKVVSMIGTSPLTRGSRYGSEKSPVVTCSDIKNTCLEGKPYDPCFRDEFIRTHPEIHGWAAIGRSDAEKLKKAIEKGTVPKNVRTEKDSKGNVGAVELALYPLKERMLEDVNIEHPEDWKARHVFNYSHVATLDRKCDDRAVFIKERTTFDEKTGFFTLKEKAEPAKTENVPKTEESKILPRMENALVVATKCIEAIQEPQASPFQKTGIGMLPPQVMGPWKMDVEAARHTLEYVYGKLHHACYMLCVTKGNPVLYKLEERTTAPGFANALFNQKLKKTMRARPTRQKQWRVIQCLVKPYSEESTFTDAYVTFLDKMSVRLPDGVFLMNLTDAVLLKKDGKEPWPMVTGPGSIGKYNYRTHIPILGGSSQVGYWDVPIPNYDDVQIILGKDKNLVNPELTNWEKKSQKAVFRGAPTGCGYTLETNMRLKLATMKSEDLDVGVITVKSNSIKFDPKEGMGQLDMTGRLKAVNRLSLDEQAGFKYIVHIDGNVAAYRLLKMMTTGSLILKVKGPYILWVDHLLKNKQHYVEVKEDLSDLKEVMEWCKSHDSECKEIAKRGMDFANKALTKEFVDASFSKILWSMSGEPNTPEFSPNTEEPDVPAMDLDEPPKVVPSKTSRWGPKVEGAPPSPPYKPLSEEESTTPKFGPQSIPGDVPPMKLGGKRKKRITRKQSRT